MGAVYLARERDSGHELALKTLVRFDPQALFRLKTEFRVLSEIAHPNLVGLGELVCEQGLWFLTMDFIDGVELLAHVRPAGGPGFDEARVRAAFTQLAGGLQALHEAGRVHRDLKPANVLVERGGRVVVLDFGLVVEVAAAPERAASGTPVYMAPEQVGGKRVRAAADWYAFGVLLYEALTGRPPFTGKDALEVLLKKHGEGPPSPQALAAGVPDDLEALCLALLHIRPELRPTGSEVLAFLQGDPGGMVGAIQAAREPRFLGRESELERLDRALAGAAEVGSIVVVVGEAGVGKSALAQSFLAGVQRRGARALVLRSRCYERETAPFKVFDGLIDDLTRLLVDREPELLETTIRDLDLSALLRVFPALARVPGIAEAAQSGVPAREASALEQRTLAFTALRELFTRLASGRTLVLFVDDLHWADRDSQALLAEIMPARDAPPLLFLATARPDVGASLPSSAQIVGLGELGPEQADALARELLGDAEAAAQVVSEAGGHPLFLTELARYVAEAGVDVAHATRLEDALGSRVERLCDEARAVLGMVCAAGVPTPQDWLVRASGLAVGDWRKGVAALRGARLARTRGGAATSEIEPYHDRVRETVYGALGASERHGIHGRIADAIEAEGAEIDSEALVRHLVAAGQGERATRHALRAARAADAAFAFEHAAELYRLSLRLADPDDEAGVQALRVALADALGNAGHGPESGAAYLEAAEYAGGATRLELLRRAGEQLLMSGHLGEGVKALTDVLSGFGLRFPRSQGRALAALLFQRFKLRLRGLRWKPRAAGDIDPALLERIDVLRAVAVGFGHVDYIRGALFHVRGLLLALRAGEPGRVAWALALETVFTSLQGRSVRARVARLLEATRAACAVAGDAYSEACGVSAEGCAAYYVEADLERSSRSLAAAEAAFRDHEAGVGWELANQRVIRLLALRRRGEIEEMCHRVPELLRDSERRGDRFAAATLARLFNVCWLVADAPDVAAAKLERWTWPDLDGSLHLQHWYGIWASGELALYRGVGPEELAPLRAEFRRVHKSLLGRIQMIRAESAWLQGRVAVAAAGHGGEGAAAWQKEALDAARRLEREGVSYAQAWGHLIRAGLSPAQERDRAVAFLRQAQACAVSAGMGLIGVAIRSRLGELTGDEALREESRAWLTARGVKSPARFVQLLAPGFALQARLDR
jgi:hypothetical protein